MASSPSLIATESVAGPLQNGMDLEAVYTSRRKDIVRMLLHSGVNVAEAEDVTQQVFANAYEHLSFTPRGGSLFTWLSACARNLAVTRYRRTLRERLVPAERWKQWEGTLIDPAKSILSHLEEQQEYLRLTEALSLLNERQQSCMLLRSKGFTFDETAAALGISRKQAVIAFSSALAALQQTLVVSDNPDRT